MINRLLIIILLFVIATNCLAQDLVLKADSIRIKSGIPELAFAVVKSDKILEEEYLGYHKVGELAKKDTATKEDYFHLGSNTKAITGFIAAYLVEHNKIKWSTKVFDLFSEWKNESDSSYYEVTLQDLLSHRGRIQPYTSGLEYKKLPNFKGSKAAQRMQFSFYLLKEKPVLKSGKALYNYSNAGYSIAASMLEKATGKTWEQLIDKIINKDLHLEINWFRYQETQVII